MEFIVPDLDAPILIPVCPCLDPPDHSNTLPHLVHTIYIYIYIYIYICIYIYNVVRPRKNRTYVMGKEGEEVSGGESKEERNNNENYREDKLEQLVEHPPNLTVGVQK